MGLEVATCPVEVEVRKWCVVRARSGDQHVIDGRGQFAEKLSKAFEIEGVEGGRARRADFIRSTLEALGVSGSKDYLGSLGACSPGGFESDACAAADDDD